MEDGEESRDYQEALSELTGLSLTELLQRGQEALTRTLVAKAEAGVATHQELAVLRNVLRDNGMTMGAPPAMKTIEGRRDLPALPVYEDPEE